MATITIGYRPDLTPERAMQIFAEHFGRRCEVTTTWIRNRDFVVKKSAWTGVGVRVKQEKDATTFVFTAVMPSLFWQFLFGGVIAYLLLRPQWKDLEAEVAAFIEHNPAFLPEQTPIPTPQAPVPTPAPPTPTVPAVAATKSTGQRARSRRKKAA